MYWRSFDILGLRMDFFLNVLENLDILGLRRVMFWNVLGQLLDCIIFHALKIDFDTYLKPKERIIVRVVVSPHRGNSLEL